MIVRRAAPLAIATLLAPFVTACSWWDGEELGTATLSVTDLPGEVQGWRLRAEARSPELDGSPTFYFSDSERVEGSAMASAETPLGARTYTLVVELADPAAAVVRRCEADLAISPGESLDLVVDASSIRASAPSGAVPPCTLEVDRRAEAGTR